MNVSQLNDADLARIAFVVRGSLEAKFGQEVVTKFLGSNSVMVAELLKQTFLAVRESIELAEPSPAPQPASVEMTLEDANNLDAVVSELGLQESQITPAEAVRELQGELKRWKDVCHSAGVCMSCAGGSAYEPCTDCLGTGWNGGAPVGFVSEAYYHRAAEAMRERAADIWRPIEKAPPFDEQPIRQFIRVTGSKYHSGEQWARVWCGVACIRPKGAPDGLLGYRASDIIQMCQDGDMDIESVQVTHWIPAIFPTLPLTQENPDAE